MRPLSAGHFDQRVEASTIRDYVGIRPGQNFTSGDVDEATKRLFATGLFSDVSVNQRGSTLVVEVSEYKVVNQVLFQGNKKIKDAQLSQGVQLKPRSTFSQSQLDADVETQREAYRRVGRDDATISGRTKRPRSFAAWSALPIQPRIRALVRPHGDPPGMKAERSPVAKRTSG